MKVARTRAIVLRRTNYGEADRILQILTPHGKRSVIAKSVRKEKSRLAGGIELFAICDVVIVEGKGGLGVITSARLVQFYRHIMEDYDSMQFAYEAIKQVTKACEMVDEPEWYDVLAEVLMALDNFTISRQLIQTWFYLRYAGLLGAELSLLHDTDGRKLKPELRYSYDVGEKGLRPSDQGDILADHIKYMRLVSIKPLAVLGQIGGLDAVLSESWYVARQHAAI